MWTGLGTALSNAKFSNLKHIEFGETRELGNPRIFFAEILSRVSPHCLVSYCQGRTGTCKLT